MKWLDDNRLQIDVPKKLKKITGTRFASVLGKNVWSTPFEMWLAITKTYEPPFEDTIYTIAGKTIEPKQADFMKETYFMDNLVSPTDVYGEDYFNKTYGDFFSENEIFGGMWDYLLVDKEGKPQSVLEMKTTKRSEDWLNDIPEYYSLQAALYAHLLGVDDVIFVATFLEDKDYKNPENFIVNTENTIVRRYSLKEKYPNFIKLVEEVKQWHNDHVKTGISPVFDEKKDAELLKVLRTNVASLDEKELIEFIEKTQEKIDLHNSLIKEDEKELKKAKDKLREKLQNQFRDGDTNVEVLGNKFIFNVSKSNKETIDKNKMIEDKIYEKYTTQTEVYTLRVKELKEN